MKTDNAYDVIIIGAGVIGLCVAYYLSKREVEVLVLEKGFINSGTSGACQCNVLTGTSFPGQLNDLAFGSLKEYEDFDAQFTHDFDFDKSGSLLLIDQESQLDVAADLVAKQRIKGRDVAILENEVIRKSIAPVGEDLYGGVFGRDDASLNSLKLTNSLAREIMHCGGRLLYESEVRRIDKMRDGSFVVKTGTEDYFCEKLVNCAGVSSPKIAQMLGQSVDVTPVKGHVLVTERNNIRIGMALREFADSYDETDESKPTDATFGIKFVLQPSFSDNSLIGKSTEFDTVQDGVSVEIIKMLSKRAIAFVPALGDINIIRCYVGFRPYSPDDTPIIGQSVEDSNFYYGTGHGGSGITLGPITGKLISQLIIDGKAEQDIDEFSPARFVAGNRTKDNSAH